MGYFEDGDSGLPIRNKLNAVASLFSLTSTDGDGSIGTITSVNVNPINVSSNAKVAFSGQTIKIVDKDTGEILTMVLSADWEKDDTSISVVSYDLVATLPDESFIFLPFCDVASYSFNS